MRNYQCSMIFGSTTITSVHNAVSRSAARYAFYKEHFTESTYAEIFRHVKVKSLGSEYIPPVAINPQQIIMDAFNEQYKVGDTVNVKQDNGSTMKCTVKHPSTILGGHTAVIWVNEISGAYLASRAF